MAQRIENVVDAAVALLLAGAVLFSASRIGLPILLATGWAVLAFSLCFWLLGSVDRRRGSYPVREFAVSAFNPDPDELLLDDVLANAGPDSRVVRLFDPVAAPRAAPPDASQALYDALAKLRRSLR